MGVRHMLRGTPGTVKSKYVVIRLLVSYNIYNVSNLLLRGTAGTVLRRRVAQPPPADHHIGVSTQLLVPPGEGHHLENTRSTPGNPQPACDLRKPPAAPTPRDLVSTGSDNADSK